MADENQVTRLKSGVRAWNQWRKKHLRATIDLESAKLDFTNLSGANLSGANLKSAHLIRANLKKACLSGANLRFANLSSADLSGADLGYANLNDADLRDARVNGADIFSILSNSSFFDVNLNHALLREHPSDTNLSYVVEVDLKHVLLNEHCSGADLSGADLSGADLSGAKLTSANLTDALFGWTMIAHVDLREVIGLATIRHERPSRIDLHTVRLPSDGSADLFLRGVGIPNEWIDFYRAARLSVINYHSLFISYASKDDTFARRLHADLQNQGVRCWFAPEDMKIGDKIRARIDEAIHLQDKLLLLLSEHALASTWVEDEVESALEKEQRQQREVLFPLRLDESVMQTSQAWAAKLRRTRHIGDFTCWTDPQAYQQAFEQLLRNLKTKP